MGWAWSVATPRGVSGAIAIVSLASDGEGPGSEAEPIDLGARRPGGLWVADLLGVDRGVVARWSEDRVDLMPHGGTEIVRALCARLADLGFVERAAAVRPEARSGMESVWLDLLARAASPRGVDLLLAQPARWREWPEAPTGARPSWLDVERWRLIDPPLVAIVGPPNVGKSTLVNALAGRGVSVVADHAGTTRDAVGAMVALDGVVVRLLDCPGEGEAGEGLDAEAVASTRRLAEDADLVVACGDSTASAPERRGSIRVALRTDLGLPEFEADAAVCAATGEGLGELAVAIRRRLVSDAALGGGAPWVFWLGA